MVRVVMLPVILPDGISDEFNDVRRNVYPFSTPVVVLRPWLLVVVVMTPAIDLLRSDDSVRARDFDTRLSSQLIYFCRSCSFAPFVPF